MAQASISNAQGLQSQLDAAQQEATGAAADAEAMQVRLTGAESMAAEAAAARDALRAALDTKVLHTVRRFPWFLNRFVDSLRRLSVCSMFGY